MPVDDRFWKYFEEGLGSIDGESVVEDLSGFCVPYGDDKWSDSGHHDFKYEVDKVVETLSVTLRTRFADWVRQLKIPEFSSIKSKLLSIDTEATFLNFNYTASLQKLYGVQSSHIKHIHGAAWDATANLILGHAWIPRKSLNYSVDHESADPRLIDANCSIDRYFETTFKPTAHIIQENASFFGSLSSVRDIIVTGSSMGDVDLPYFREIISRVGVEWAHWRISYYDDLDDIRSQIGKLGIPANCVEFFHLAKLQTPINKLF